MAKIYNAPQEIKAPELDFSKIGDYQNDCKKYVADLKEWLNKNGYSGEEVGEVIKFPVADGYAEYMVASLRPVTLIHLPLMDAWHFEYAKNLTAKDVRAKITQQKSIAKLFSSKAK